MEEAVINSDIKRFIAKAGEDFFILRMDEITPEKLTSFNMELYKYDFNAARYSNQKKILEFWKWKYSQNPASEGMKNFGWVAIHKGEPVGQFHIIPAIVKIEKNSYRGAWGSDLGILMKYRNLGLSAFLIQRAREELGNDFALFLLGGMNTNSYNVFKRSGFQDIGRMPRYIKVLDWKKVFTLYGLPDSLSTMVRVIADLAHKIHFFMRKHQAGIKIENLMSFDKRLEEFLNYISGNYKCMVRRDIGFITWRYLKQPLWSYTVLKAEREDRIKGIAVLREGEVKNGRLKGLKTGVITDLLVDPRDKPSMYRLLEEVVRFFKDRNAALIKCDILGAAAVEALASIGFIRIKSPCNSISYMLYLTTVI